ncbi:MAG: carboxypeptidase-like regulatory domain-containing protein [Sphingobacteriales bacterium]|nr:carboxypeptidase-like regulatory domain-containing protein [Sphingobacteriales bacterium]
MPRTNASLILLFLFFTSPAFSQTTIKGTVYDASTDSVLAGVTVMNSTGKSFVLTDKNGNYSIPAREDDKLVFTISGYETDTLPVENYMFYTRMDMTLHVRSLLLKGITVVATDYRTDSLNRRAYYSHLLDHKEPGLTGRNTPAGGFGIVLSPLSHFSRTSRQRRELRKRLERAERDDYIDRIFSAELVKRVTRLEGDSLRLFMYWYRPTYDFCRHTSSPEILIYISDKLKEFRKPVLKKPG